MGVGVLSKNTYNNFAPEATPDFLIALKYHPSFPREKTFLVNPDLMRAIENCEEERFLKGYLDPEIPARFFSTSGTTGRTRYIAYSAGELEALSARKSPYDIVGLEYTLSLYPFGSGQNYRLALKGLLAGRTFYASEFRDFHLPKFLSENPIRTISASPVQIAGLLDVATQTGTKLPLLKTIIMGGSPPSAQLVERIKSQLDCRIFNAYGSTEAGNIGFVEVTNGVPESEGFDLVHDDVSLQIVDDSDNPLPAMSVGHIRYRRENMSTSYYKNPEATARFFKDGYFYPGDLGFLDHQGRLLLEGRSTDVINLGGVKINPERIESIALAQLGVRDCAAFAAVSASGVEELAIALVVDSDFNQGNFEKAMEMKSPQAIRQAKIVAAIPRNETGKIQRHLLATE
jgi:acyl-coenzyme A synthetase/AMP-(fatty) acid ligase